MLKHQTYVPWTPTDSSGEYQYLFYTINSAACSLNTFQYAEDISIHRETANY